MKLQETTADSVCNSQASEVNWTLTSAPWDEKAAKTLHRPLAVLSSEARASLNYDACKNLTHRCSESDSWCY